MKLMQLKPCPVQVATGHEMFAASMTLVPEVPRALAGDHPKA